MTDPEFRTHALALLDQWVHTNLRNDKAVNKLKTETILFLWREAGVATEIVHETPKEPT